jgi:hypothetical protein
MPGPTDLEQLLLEYVNAARLNPLGDAAHYVNGYTPLTSPDPGVQSAINFFGVSGPAFFAQMSALTPTQPLAWNDAIAAASRAHSQAMINADSQSHQLPGEPGFGDRVTNAGYNFSSLGENIFAFAQSMLYGHAGFMIDWGAGSDGMQTPAGHRLNIMNSTFREIGIGVVADANPATAVGPYVITEDLGRALNGPSVLLLGVAYNDTDNNNFLFIRRRPRRTVYQRRRREHYQHQQWRLRDGRCSGRPNCYCFGRQSHGAACIYR